MTKILQQKMYTGEYSWNAYICSFFVIVPPFKSFYSKKIFFVEELDSTGENW